MTEKDPSVWLHCDAPVPDAEQRLVCFAHAGGSASFFRSWARRIPGVEVYAACLPGRAQRIEEPAAEDLCELGIRMADAVEQLADKPISLFGHSMGAAVALETARELERRGLRIEHLFASGSRHGRLPEPTPAPSEDPEEVLARLVELGGTDEELAADPAFRDLVVPYVLSDARMFHSYAMRPEPVLRCPITTIVGDADDEADRRPWRALTSGSVHEHSVRGGHFYLIEQPPLPLIERTLTSRETYLWRSWTPLRADPARLTIRSGRGNRVWDAEGREFLDASSLNASCGYAHPHVVEAASRQLGLMHGVDLSVYDHEQAFALARRLASHFPKSLSRTTFHNSGSEGVEAALMMAIGYWSHRGERRDRVVSFARGYHGATALVRSLSGLPVLASPYMAPLRVSRVELPAPPRDIRVPESMPTLIDSFDRAIGLDPNNRPAAVVVEPLLNVGGGVVLPPGFLRALRELCDARDTLLIVDEVFTGCGRTGRMFGFQHEPSVEPDIVVSSKGLSGGYAPLSAVTAQQRIHDSFSQDPYISGLRYGHTTSGHAVACAAAVAVLDVVEREGLVERSEKLGAHLLALLEPLMEHGRIVDVRGLGLTLVVETDTEETGGLIADHARDHGLLLRQQREMVMAVPPLTVDEATVDLIAERLTAAVEAVGRR